MDFPVNYIKLHKGSYHTMLSSEPVAHAKNQKQFAFDASSFEPKVAQLAQALVLKFRSVTKFYTLFHIAFLGAAFVEVVSILLFFSFFSQSTWAAISLATVFLTFFSYFVLLFYFQAKKPQQFMDLRDSFFQGCENLVGIKNKDHEYYLSLSYAMHYCAELLNGLENSYYSISKNFKTLAPLLEKFSIWVHWKDIHTMKELLLLLAVHENISLVKAAPTDLEAHACLANTYLSLAKLYIDPRNTNKENTPLWVSPEYASASMKDKFQSASSRAVEEFKILNDYAPNDPWVHAQLAEVYHLKRMPKEEIQEYETLLKIVPGDKEILFRLGVLYFEEGHTARGLRIYEELKKSKEKKAEELLQYYDSFDFLQADIN